VRWLRGGTQATEPNVMSVPTVGSYRDGEARCSGQSRQPLTPIYSHFYGMLVQRSDGAARLGLQSVSQARQYQRVFYPPLEVYGHHRWGPGPENGLSRNSGAAW